MKGNIIVLDVETLRSADECRWCLKGKEAHLLSEETRGPAWLCTPPVVAGAPAGPGTAPHYAPLGWDDHATLGLSIGCYYDYQGGLVHWFDAETVHDTMGLLILRDPLIVSFNGRQFDGPLMRAVAMAQKPYPLVAHHLAGWQALWDRSYDILHEIWQASPTRKFERGLNSLDALAQANGFGAKAMTGADAPRRWREGQYAKVLNYNQGDVLKTQALFELILGTGEILRGDNKPIKLRAPLIS